MNADHEAAVEMLPMPHPRDLNAEQIEGTVCVWCAGPPQLRLGPRISVVGGKLTRWFPRACMLCTEVEAARVNQVHIRTCQRCTRSAYCADSRALAALASKAPAERAAPHAGRDGRISLGGEERP